MDISTSQSDPFAAEPAEAALRPLSSSPGQYSALLIDTRLPYLDLQNAAEQRLYAVRGLLFSLSCMGVKDACATDVGNIASAAYLLMEDGVDLLRAAQEAARREWRVGG